MSDTAVKEKPRAQAVVTAPDHPPQLPAEIQPQPTSLLPAIIQMARDNTVDVAKLKELLVMQERLEEREAKREFTAAFARLSADLPRVKKNGTISLMTKEGQNKGSIAFAKWEDMDKVIRPLMAREGFTLSFDSAPRPGDGGGLIVTGTLIHRDGHMRTASMPLALDTGPGRNNLQAMGSTLSYGKRYCAEMLLNIVRDGEDDDGKLGGTRFIKPDQVAELGKLIEETETDERRFLDVMGVKDLSEIETGAFAAAKNMLLQKQSKKKGAGS